MRHRHLPQASARPWAKAIACLLFLAASLLASAAHAAPDCAPSTTAGVERCVTGLSPASLRRMYQPQQLANWCWAASVAMLLGRYGLQLSQEQVARSWLGRADDEPVTAEAISDLLNRSWQDASGRSLVTSASPLPPWRRALGLLAPEVLDDLAQGRPLLVGAQRHAMVLVQLVYEKRTDAGAAGALRLVRAVVLDPAGGAWLRSLRPNELRPEYLARVHAEPTGRAEQVAFGVPAPDGAELLSR